MPLGVTEPAVRVPARLRVRRGELSMGAASLVVASCIVVVCVACEVGPRSGLGLRLPDGDVAQGERTFQELGCVRCHDVAGVAPPGDERSDVIVTSGGEVTASKHTGSW
jgi:hypothetical protein